jgi:hypothetical protein
MGERLGVCVRAASASASTNSAASSSTATTKLEKLAVNRSPPLSQEAMERVGPISSSASCYLSEPCETDDPRVLAPVTARGLPPYEDDAVHGPDAQRAVICSAARVEVAADSAQPSDRVAKTQGSSAFAARQAIKNERRFSRPRCFFHHAMGLGSQSSRRLCGA